MDELHFLFCFSSVSACWFQTSAKALGLLTVKAIVAITAIIVGGRLLLRPIYKQVVENQNAEIFFTNAVLVILGTSLLTTRSWKHVTEEVTTPMFQRLTDQFDIQSTDVSKAMATKYGRSLSTRTYRLRIKYLNHKSAKGEEYARSHPPPECDLEKWKNSIDKKWNDSNCNQKRTLIIEIN
ncbi:unnamed protein product [Camellia sinensis]